MFKEITVHEIEHNAYDMFQKNWALVSSGDEQDFNTMTVSWGMLGHLWFNDIANVYVRPSRYTYEYMEKNDYFTISFFFDKNREDLSYLGKVSGRDEDKVSKTSLTPIFIDGTVAFEQAEYVFVCKKAHSVEFTREQFTDKAVCDTYTDDNLHVQYSGVVKKVYKKI